jgi:uncharacterized phosphosugar-binding protein
MPENTDYVATYFNTVQGMLKNIVESQSKQMSEAARIFAETIKNDAIIHIFGTGHSHLCAEELYCRAGGLAPVNAMLETNLMLHQGALKSTALERLTGYAAMLLSNLMPSAKDCLVIISNSGRNAVPVEMAIEAKKYGIKTIILTSLATSRSVISRAPSGRRLFEVGDVVIDNCGVIGDAAVPIDEKGTAAGPTSTITGAFILNAIVLEACSLMKEAGIDPPLFSSGNVEGGEVRNIQLVQQYRNRVRF